MYPPVNPKTDPNPKKAGDSHKTHKIFIGVIIGIAFIAIAVGLFVYFNPDKCRSKRGDSVAFDDDAIHQVSKQQMIDKIKENTDLM